MPFKDESDVRDWLRKQTPKRSLFWVEAAGGGTQGFPDAIVVRQSAPDHFIELKVGTLLVGQVQFEMNNTQRIALRRIAEAGGRAFVIVGEAGGERVWVGLPQDVRPKPSLATPVAVQGRIAHVMPSSSPFRASDGELQAFLDGIWC